MATTNKSKKKVSIYDSERLAGGYGPNAAKQSNEANLRRLVMTCLLWEDNAYCDGQSVVDEIKRLVPLCDPVYVASLAVEARYEQKLRHVPLLVVREMARHNTHKHLVGSTLAEVINRPDEIAEFLSLYWKTNGKKKSISSQVKKGLAASFDKFDEYQFGKWAKDNKEVKIRDVLFLTHPRPSQDKQQLFKRIADNTLDVPDTWEVGLSAAKGNKQKAEVWERLITENKLGALAFLKNIRGMSECGVPKQTIANGLKCLRPSMLLPIDFVRAARAAPDWMREIEEVMLRCLSIYPKLKGWTVFVVDVSGSMGSKLAAKTDSTRMDVAATMAMMASEMCEHVTIYATAGSDMMRTHKTEKIKPLRGFGLADEIVRSSHRLGGGGIFTRQCLEYIRSKEKEIPDRIIVFSDSQDCDFPHQRIPAPFGKYNYIVDISAETRGINYKGIWTAEISSYSERFLPYIHTLESSWN